MYITQAGTIAWAQPAGAAGSPEGTPTTGTPEGDPGTGQAPAAGPCGGMGSGTSIIMMVVMVAVFYFLL